jgi:hypothetical protein
MPVNLLKKEGKRIGNTLLTDKNILDYIKRNEIAELLKIEKNFKFKENEILNLLQKEDYEYKVANNPQRAKYVSGFLKKEKRNPDDIKFVLDNINRLDEYCKSEIQALSELFTTWGKEYKDLPKICKKFGPDNWGRYSYPIKLPCFYQDENTKIVESSITQYFRKACFSGEIDIKYDKFNHILKRAEYIPKLLKCNANYKKEIYDNIFNNIVSLKNEFKDLSILWGCKTCSLNDYHFKYLKNKLDEIEISNMNISDISGDKLNRHIIIIDIVTTNEELISNCEYVINSCKKIRPLIIYLSLLKCYDYNEVEEIISKEDKRLQEEKKKEQQRIIEEKKKEEERIRIQQEKERKEKERKIILSNLKDKVSSWKTTKYGLPYKYLVDYYPVNKYNDSDEFVWEDRWLVWNFKNTPGRTEDHRHEEALDYIVPGVSDILNKTFGYLINNLTLVCVTASNEDANYARYYEFSNRLCKNTGMLNSFSKINIINDAIPKHLGGDGKPDLSFDDSFFKDKNVILFDDVITSGRSLHLYKNKLESFGANVICAFTVGRTI